jgi:hypothetical protein
MADSVTKIEVFIAKSNNAFSGLANPLDVTNVFRNYSAKEIMEYCILSSIGRI